MTALVVENCEFGGKLSSWYSTDCRNADIQLRKYVNTAVGGAWNTSRCVTSVLFFKQANTPFALPSSHCQWENLLLASQQKTDRTIFFATMSSKTGLSFSSLDVVSPTIEAVTLNAISGLLAQAFTAYKAKVISNFQPGEGKAALTISAGSFCSGSHADSPIHVIHCHSCGAKLHFPDSAGKMLSHKDCAQVTSETSLRQRQEE